MQLLCSFNCLNSLNICQLLLHYSPQALMWLRRSLAAAGWRPPSSPHEEVPQVIFLTDKLCLLVFLIFLNVHNNLKFKLFCKVVFFSRFFLGYKVLCKFLCQNGGCNGGKYAMQYIFTVNFLYPWSIQTRQSSPIYNKPRATNYHAMDFRCPCTTYLLLFSGHGACIVSQDYWNRMYIPISFCSEMLLFSNTQFNPASQMCTVAGIHGKVANKYVW